MTPTNEEIDEAVADLRYWDCALTLDAANMLLALKARAETAEKDRDEYFLQWQNLRLNGTAHWQQLAEAAEKERNRLRLVLERISNAKPHLKDLVRAALEAKL